MLMIINVDDDDDDDNEINEPDSVNDTHTHMLVSFVCLFDDENFISFEIK